MHAVKMLHKYITIVGKSTIQISTVAVYLLVLRGPVVIQAMTWIIDFGVQIMAWITDDSTIGQIVMPELSVIQIPSVHSTLFIQRLDARWSITNYTAITGLHKNASVKAFTKLNLGVNFINIEHRRLIATFWCFDNNFKLQIS